MTTTRRTFLLTIGTAGSIGTAGTSAAVAQKSPTILMATEDSSFYFDPIGLHVEPGTTVTFKIASGVHTATAYEQRIPEGAPVWDSGMVSGKGSTWTHTFETAGTHDYYCTPHKTLGMVGRIVVGEPGGPAEGSMPPNGDVPKSQVIVEQGAVSYESFIRGAGGGKDGLPLLGAGLLGGIGALAAVAYWVVNSEGERYRVGSSEWRKRNGLQ